MPCVVAEMWGRRFFPPLVYLLVNPVTGVPGARPRLCSLALRRRRRGITRAARLCSLLCDAGRQRNAPVSPKRRHFAPGQRRWSVGLCECRGEPGLRDAPFITVVVASRRRWRSAPRPVLSAGPHCRAFVFIYPEGLVPSGTGACCGGGGGISMPSGRMKS